MKRDMTVEQEARFNMFWTDYPRKKDKVDARRAWRRLNPSEVELILILQGINRYMASGDWKDPQFIPYPATFLNHRRWEDEIATKGQHDDQPDAEHCLFKKGYIPRQARTA